MNDFVTRNRDLIATALSILALIGVGWGALNGLRDDIRDNKRQGELNAVSISQETAEIKGLAETVNRLVGKIQERDDLRRR